MNFYGNTNEPPPVGEVNIAPDDTVAGLSFSPRRMPSDFLVSGTWAGTVSCYEVTRQPNGSYKGELRASHQHPAPVLDVCWTDDSTKIFSASADKTVKMWDLSSNQQMQVAAHEAPVRTVHWVKTNQYSCIMTTSWDKTIKFWDLRSQNALSSINLPDKPYCADVSGQMAVVSTADRSILIYKLEPSPALVRQNDSPFKFQHKCISIFAKEANGYAVGSIEGRVAIQYVMEKDPKGPNFTFKCHRSIVTSNSTFQDIFAVNDIAFNPVYGTMATIGSDGKYSFWDKDSRTRLRVSDQFDTHLTRCSINSTGEIFAYGLGYDWSKGHEYSNANQKNKIHLHYCGEEMKPAKKTK